MPHNYYVYILAGKKNGTLYTGVTNDLLKRVHQHKTHISKGFTNDHHVTKLVYYEHTTDVNSALNREKQLKAMEKGLEN
jgi:putative endonuclease